MSNASSPQAAADLNTTLHQQLRTLGRAAAGFSSSDVSGFSPEHVYKVAQALVKAGELHRVRMPNRRVRYFADADQAHRAIQAENQGSARRTPTLGTRAKPLWSPDEPGLITSRTKITKAPPLPDNVYRTNTYWRF
jgi:hypothetical protein